MPALLTRDAACFAAVAGTDFVDCRRQVVAYRPLREKKRPGEGASIGGVTADIAWLMVWALVLLVAAGRVFRRD